MGIFRPGDSKKVDKILVGGYPNGLAFDPSEGNLLAANVPGPDDASPITVSIVDVGGRILSADIAVPGRTRWTIFDEEKGRFYVNIAKPSQILAVPSKDPDGASITYDIPAVGPHGLDIDREGRRLFCACDQGILFTINLHSGSVTESGRLSGSPDVVFYNPKMQHLYIAIGDPGVIDVFDTNKMKLGETVKTGRGAHTIGFSQKTNKIYAFLPESHQASIFVDE